MGCDWSRDGRGRLRHLAARRCNRHTPSTRVATGSLADPCRRRLSDQQPDHRRRVVCQRRVLRSRSRLCRSAAANAYRNLVGDPSTQRLCDRNDCADGSDHYRVAGHQEPRRFSALDHAGALRGGCPADRRVLSRASVSDPLHDSRRRGLRGVRRACRRTALPGPKGPGLHWQWTAEGGSFRTRPISRSRCGDPDRVAVHRIAAMEHAGADAARSAMGPRREHRQARRHRLPRT